MSELSDGGNAYGKGSTPDGNEDRPARKRRRRKGKKRPSSASRQTQGLSPGKEGQGAALSHARSNTDPEQTDAVSGRRRRRTRRPGRGKNPANNPVVTAEPTAQTEPVNPHNLRRERSGTGSRNHSASAYAALDLGTNNCRLLIAVPRPKGRFRVIDGFSRIVRLGEGLSQTGGLGQAAMDRAIEALKVCAGKLETRQIKRQRLIATEACRQASNGEEFLERVTQETGLELEVVSRETEARLAAEGCGTLMDRDSDAAVMFDIGGGSTELILVRGRKGRIKDRIFAWTSLPLGVVTLAEKFGGKDITRTSFADMISYVRSQIDGFEEARDFNGYEQMHLLGTSGTVTTLAGIHLELPRYERRKVDGLWLRSSEIDTVTERLLSMSYEERKKNPCVGAERADLVLAGCAILEAIRESWPAERLRVADRGLREGLLTEMMQVDQVWRFRPGRRRRKPRKQERS